MSQLSATLTGSLSSFLDRLRLRFIVVGALMLRELHTRYGRENIGFLWIVGEPLLFCLGVTAFWTTVRPSGEHGLPVTSFILTGYAPLMIWRHAVSRSVLCFTANASLLYHKQVGVLDLLAARIVLESMGAIVAFVIVGLLFSLFGAYSLPRDFGLFYLGWFYMILFSAGCAVVFACGSEMADWVEKITAVVGYLMIPVSGFVFMVDWLPTKAREYALYMPSVHAFEMIRGGQYGAEVTIHYDIAYVSFSCAIIIVIGLAMTRRVRKYIQVE